MKSKDVPVRNAGTSKTVAICLVQFGLTLSMIQEVQGTNNKTNYFHTVGYPFHKSYVLKVSFRLVYRI